jgi:transcriptional regulator with XRE-family HTH domain
MANILDFNLNNPHSVMDSLKDRFKQKRLRLDFTQQGLSTRSGVSLGSLKRFEATGLISVDKLLKLSLVLGCLDDFKHICDAKPQKINSIDDLLKIKKRRLKKTTRQRGTIK